MKILFDLDGTLTDSGAGIMKCVALTLAHYGIAYEETDLRAFVGPPLRASFPRAGVPADQVEEAVAYYRARYWTEGKLDNAPYPGIRALLQKLQAAGHRLYIATSKPEALAVEVLERFALDGYFEQVSGATEDSSRENKDAVIAYLLERTGGPADAVMVGDTVLDVLGAAKVGIPAIGVGWGYGNLEEMRAAGAKAIAHSPEELYALLQSGNPV